MLQLVTVCACVVACALNSSADKGLPLTLVMQAMASRSSE